MRGNRKELVHMLTVFATSAVLLSCSSHKAAVATPETVLSEHDRMRYEQYYLEAISQDAQGNYDAAYDLLRHCLDICPDGASALYELANYHSMLGEKDRSLELLKHAVEVEPDNYWYEMSLAMAYYSNRDMGPCIAIYEQMSERFPKRAAELLPSLATLYQATEQYDKELATLDRIEKRFGSSDQLTMQRYSAYWNNNEQEKAYGVVEKLVADHPDDSRYDLMLADIYTDNGRYSDARATLDAVLAGEPDNALAWLGIANICQKNGDKQQAAHIVDSMLYHGNLSAEMRLNLTKSYIQSLAESNVGSDEMERAYDLLLSQQPDNLVALKQQLYYAMERGDVPAIARRAHALKAQHPDELYVYYYLALTAIDMGDNNAAADHCRDGIARISDESETGYCLQLYSILGDLCTESHRMAEAFAAYDSALVYNPTEVTVLNNYAYNLCLEGGDLERAEQMSHITVQKEPANPTYLDTYAWVLFLKERYEEARIYIDEALKNDSTASDVLLEHAGDIYWHLNLRTEATEFWTKALQTQTDEHGKGLRSEAPDPKLSRKVKQKKYIR